MRRKFEKTSFSIEEIVFNKFAFLENPSKLIYLCNVREVTFVKSGHFSNSVEFWQTEFFVVVSLRKKISFRNVIFLSVTS